MHNFEAIGAWLLSLPFVALLLAGLYLTCKSRGVQFRALGTMLRLLVSGTARGGSSAACSPRDALRNALSTTLGVGNVVGPIVAIEQGGPGALVGYVLATLLGSATLFAEVSLALGSPRRPGQGGPLLYLHRLAPRLATLYALGTSLLLLGWSAANANVIAGLLQAQQVDRRLTAALLAAALLTVMGGGLGRISRLNAHLVPLMCGLYCAACLSIVLLHRQQLGATLLTIGHDFFRPQPALLGGGLGATVQVLRHGLARALQANEAGVGTATIPHSFATGHPPAQQAALAIAAVWFNGFLCLLTGLTALLGRPQHGQAQGVAALQLIFVQHFGAAGTGLLSLSIFLFAFGTLVGNTFNGRICAQSLLPGPLLPAYTGAAALAVACGCLAGLHAVFACTDLLIIPVVGINVYALLRLAARGEIDFALPTPAAAAAAPTLVDARRG